MDTGRQREAKRIKNEHGVILKFGSVMYFIADIQYDSNSLDKGKSLERAIVMSSKEAIILRYFENYSDANFFCCADTIDLSQGLSGWDESYINLLVCNGHLSARKFDESRNNNSFGIHEIVVDREPIMLRYSKTDYIIERIQCESTYRD